MAVALIFYEKPDDVEQFNDHYYNKHVTLVEKIPGLRSLKVSKNPATTLAGDKNYFMAIELEFKNGEEMRLALQSAESQAAAADLANLRPPGRIRFTFERRSLMPSAAR
jgi:uncharacterized protein (TIGR02118 family)